MWQTIIAALPFIGDVASSVGKGLWNVIAGGAELITGTISAAVTAFENVAEKMSELQEASYGTMRSVGGNLQEAIAYTRVLTQETARLAMAYGVGLKEIAEVQATIFANTGRAIIASQTVRESLVAAHKVIGRETVSAFEQQFDAIGGSVQSATEAAIDAYVKASKSGFVAADFSRKVAENIKLANSYSFKDGVEGITRMTAMSEKLSVNLANLLRGAEKFEDIETSIESAARLQMLGGQPGMLSVNPLEMMYESIYDPEAFATRMEDMFKGAATFDYATGEARVNGGERLMMKARADALGMSLDDAMRIAKNSARIEAINASIGGSGLAGLTEEQQTYIANKAQYNQATRQFEITGADGVTRNLSQMTPQQLAAMQSVEGMANRQEFMGNAAEMVTINERIAGFTNSIGAAFKDVLIPFLQPMDEVVRSLPTVIGAIGEEVGEIADVLQNGGIWEAGKKLLSDGWNGVTSVVTGTIDKTKQAYNNQKTLQSGVPQMVSGVQVSSATTAVGATATPVAVQPVATPQTQPQTSYQGTTVQYVTQQAPGVYQMPTNGIAQPLPGQDFYNRVQGIETVSTALGNLVGGIGNTIMNDAVPTIKNNLTVIQGATGYDASGQRYVNLGNINSLQGNAMYAYSYPQGYINTGGIGETAEKPYGNVGAGLITAQAQPVQAKEQIITTEIKQQPTTGARQDTPMAASSSQSSQGAKAIDLNVRFPEKGQIVVTSNGRDQYVDINALLDNPNTRDKIIKMVHEAEIQENGKNVYR